MVKRPVEEAVEHPVEPALVLIVHYQDHLTRVTLAQRDSPFEAVESSHGVDCRAILVVTTAPK